MKKVITVELDSTKDIVKLPMDAKPLGCVASGDGILASFEVDEAAPIKAYDVKYPEIDEPTDLEGFTHAGNAYFNDNTVVVPVYIKAM